MRCALFPVYDLTVRRGGLPLHGALVERDGRGVLLVGRSGVGKSTACRRLPPRWNALGDDLALAVRRPGGGFAVHPLPTWSAVGPDLEKRAWDINRGVHLSAVFFLTQAAEDEILPAGKAMATVVLADAAMKIFESVRVHDQSIEKKLLRRQCLRQCRRHGQVGPDLYPAPEPHGPLLGEDRGGTGKRGQSPFRSMLED